jgi:hypothetical protein
MHLTVKDTQKLKERTAICQANGNWKPAGIAILISDKVAFKTTLIRKNKGHNILIKGTIHEQDKAIINLYVPKLMHPIS